jgi:type III pantothenate kinase
MLLAVDIGNTNIVLGLFDKNRLISKQRILTNGSAGVKVRGRVDAAIISSVVPHLTGILSRQIKKRYGIRPIIVNWKNIDLKIALRKKTQIGVDRLVNAAAVKRIYGVPAVIIDFGTATTFCALDRRGRYLGGAITSGLAISRDVLRERTAKLPLIEIKKPKTAIGQNTVEAMRSGLFYGHGRRDDKKVQGKAGTERESNSHRRAFEDHSFGLEEHRCCGCGSYAKGIKYNI